MKKEKIIKIENKFSLTKQQVLRASCCLVAACLYICASTYFFFIVNKNLDLKKTISFFGIVFLLFFSMYVFLYYADIETLKKTKRMIVICTILVVSYSLIMLSISFISIYVAPFALGALLVGLLVGRKSGFFANFVTLLVVFFTLLFFENYEIFQNLSALLVGVVTSVVAAFASSLNSRRIKYIFVAIYLGLVCCVGNVLLVAASDVSLTVESFKNLLLFSSLSGFLTVGLFLLFVPLFEAVFNLVTDFRLAELTSTDQPLLKRLFLEAPGTFNHSLIVANYAEACASAIGENSFLARAAGYYHDIGKLNNPTYFTENQMDGHNPHDDITPELSASIIKQHAVNGFKLAKEYSLPIEVAKMTVEHHGTMPIKYFYDKAQKYSESQLSAKDFMYDGAIPSTKIAAILMICDASEATLRALSNDKKLTAHEIVNSIVQERLERGQLSDCDITMKDINIIKQTIVTTYIGITHERIKYWGQSGEESAD